MSEDSSAPPAPPGPPTSSALFTRAPPFRNLKTGVQPIHASEINPRLYLGSVDAARNKEWLNSTGITHILTLAELSPHFPEDFHYLVIPIDDHPSVQYIDLFPQINEFLGQALESSPHHKVLVHCLAGMSRSATGVIGYLMFSEELSFSEAFDRVKKARPIVSPNKGFLSELKKYEKQREKDRREEKNQQEKEFD